jgi:CRISPR-associated protein Csm1
MARVVDFQKKALKAAGEFAGGDSFWLVDHLCGAVEASVSLVPSAFWHSRPDVTLACHLQLAGAFAGAMAAGNVREDLDLDKAPEEPIATLIAGDLSGIQAFIHRVASKGAARSLRARSFYLTALSLTIARFVAEQVGVTSANVLSSVGGNFLVLGPPGCEDALRRAALEVDRALVEAHGSALSVALAAHPLTPAAAKDFPSALREVRQRLAEAKARRAEFTAQELRLFEPRGDGGPLRACRSCGDDAPGGREEDGERICRFCHALETLGRELPTAQYLTVEPAAGRDAPDWQVVTRQLGYVLTLHQGAPKHPFQGAIYALSPGALKDVPCARLLPAGRYVPRASDGTVLDFRELAKKSDGRQLLAVLKADVDDLGKTFTEHFRRNGSSPGQGGRPAQSPSRIVTLMRFLSLFFEGRVNDLAENAFRDVYVVFAGGDDLALVGPWDHVLELIKRVRKEFGQWTAGNPDFHFSTGISLGDASRPVIAALDEAERLLGLAKSLRGKNAVALLDDRVLPWDDFQQALDWYVELKDLVRGAGAEGGVARSLLQRLKRLEQLSAPQGGKIIYGPELWRTYYSLRRFAERYKHASTQMDSIYQRALTPNGGLKLAIAARLAEFATSEKQGG